MEDCAEQALAVCAEQLQNVNLSELERSAVVEKFCEVWQSYMKSSSCSSPPNKPTEEENWKQLKARCEEADIAFYKVADELSRLKKEVTEHESEYGCTQKTRKWRHYLSDHMPVMYAYDCAIGKAMNTRIKLQSFEDYAKRMADRDRVLVEQGRKKK